jgi:glycosyltransferase involved in cell wall biosynthesis
MRITVLNVAYPLAPVSQDTAGGAEQVLAALDRALVSAGHRSFVIACEGSQIAGTLIATPRLPPPFDNEVKTAAWRNHAVALEQALRRVPVDIVHMHGLDFHAYLPPPGVPTLVTLHLPLDWYAPGALRPSRRNTFFHCVSRFQHRTASGKIPLLPPIENGVAVEALRTRRRKRNFALFIGRICPEKGVHLAIEAAKRADIPLITAGEVFPYGSHIAYFEERIKPHLSKRCRFIGPIGFRRKKLLLGMARCVLVPSLVDETSSLVAREALAAGTPVVAFARGALADTVENGMTGVLVDTVEEMSLAIHRVSELDPELCRKEARRRFPLGRMVERYFELYRELVESGASVPA